MHDKDQDGYAVGAIAILISMLAFFAALYIYLGDVIIGMGVG